MQPKGLSNLYTDTLTTEKSSTARMDRARTIQLVHEHITGVKLGNDKLLDCVGFVSTLVGGMPNLVATHFTGNQSFHLHDQIVIMHAWGPCVCVFVCVYLQNLMKSGHRT